MARNATRRIRTPRIEGLTVSNYRALKSLELRELKPLTVLLGPNGSGKSTLFDVFSFLRECFSHGLRHAWDRRGKGKELRTRGTTGPITIQLKYKEEPSQPTITYHLAIDEGPRGPIVKEEWLSWRRKQYGQPFRFLNFENGKGEAISGEEPDEQAKRTTIELKSADLIAVNALGQFSEHPRVVALRDFITDWYVSYLSVDETRGMPEAGPQEKLNTTGSNLANVLKYLHENESDRLEEIFTILRERIPRIESVIPEDLADGRLLLRIKDAPFEEPILSRFASDGTMKMLAYLVVLHDPRPPKFIGIEEPENFLHPRLLPGLAEECRKATAHSQLLVTTHSPYFLQPMRPEEVRVLYRDVHGYTQVEKVSDVMGIREFIEAGASLGDLWMEGRFGAGDPLNQDAKPLLRRT